MPNNANLQRQRFLGGALGVIVLGFALTYHFFPRLFHVDPTQAPRRSMSLGTAAPGSGLQPERATAISELNAGPPLTLAPAAVIAARNSAKADLPKQLSADPPEVVALLDKATRALHAGALAGGEDSAAALFEQALKQKPDSRRAVQGLFDVRARLVAEIDQDIAVGDVDAAHDLLDALRTLPNAEAEVAQLETGLQTLEKVRPMLARAAGLLQQGKADRPDGGSALDLYRDVQKLDPQNAVAEQGILQVQRAVLDRALAAVAQNDFAGADGELARAQQIRPGTQQMRDVHQRVDDMREQRARGILAQAHTALDAGNVTLAIKLAGQVRAIDPDLTGLPALDEQLVNARLYASYKPGQAFADHYVDLQGKAPTMVVIPTGSFMMGAPAGDSDRLASSQPQHAVTIATGFAMARSAVTVVQFREFVRASGYVPDSIRLGGASVYDERSGVLRDDSTATWEDDYAGRKADDNLPVVNVSWADATAYAAWLQQRTGKTYRLPSEAEFEYALRGGTKTRYWWGDGVPSHPVENLTGSADRSRSGRRWSNAFRGYRDGHWGPAPVMSFAANPFGLFDIDGNVSEWVVDCWHDSYLRAPTDGSAWVNPGCRAHVLRGGSWGSSPEQVESAYRQGANGDARSARVGFRVVREL
ncbi:SUMF1/EgtB/PvdO family nonheme iron enzyme [Rhodanobacter sp. FDAARGOS 1247]|uniref:formylglycine-generating enzyme family protein n=1 Tax=Rhodanobacter sp. FDAARGOS 1247 TaxID=2778082 RepID=UPI0019519053|nr:formylglycine-generating enzyme family protein [Rhodanobacter sp. FDAARGOS 1247]QRP62519.1 SUMF1/EgtB/PvdO family nonheme iron enzyme [Rhodanobacter sp. FDAARGOS 1247]